MKKHLQLFIAALSFLFLLPTSGFAKKAPARALFVSVIEKEQVLASREHISRLVDFSEKAGIKTLFVQIYRANMAWFPSEVADRSPYDKCLKSVGEDPLALLIRVAHEKGIEVHAWVNLLSLSKNTKAPILKKYGPGILTRNIHPKKTLEDYKIDNQYFLEPADGRVRRHLEKIVDEILHAYPGLDGIQFDYIRYPDARPFYGHSPDNIARFKEASGVKVVREDSLAWKDWKRSRVTLLLEALVRKIRKIKKEIHISTTGCMSYVRAREEAFQDWAVWLDQGLVEFVTIMSYPDNMLEFKRNIEEAREKVTDFKKLGIGVGAYKFIKDPETFIQQFDLCEKSSPGRCVVFYYGSLNENTYMRDYLTGSIKERRR